MFRTYLESSNIISSLGLNTRDTMEKIRLGRSGIRLSTDRQLSEVDFPVSLIDWSQVDELAGDIDAADRFTRFEKIALLSVQDALEGTDVDPTDPGTALILSTTKGNVELLAEPNAYKRDRLSLWKSADLIAGFFGIRNKPVVISNACISGVVAILMARQMIRSSKCERVIVLGADVLSQFIVSGFQSFLSLSEKACQPFDLDRDGLSLGEAASTLIISKRPGEIELMGGAITNDANHISGPSRNGEGLLLAMEKTLGRRTDIDLISAHGTATVYNDEMESIAFSRAGLGSVPVNSLKAYVGHTLGAAGILETIINVEAMKENMLVPTKGFSNPGVSAKINVVKEKKHLEIGSMLKVASGFGGSNAAALFEKKA